jgi:hypothetical protein
MLGSTPLLRDALLIRGRKRLSIRNDPGSVVHR